MHLDMFTTAYVECALWSSTDNSTESGGYPLDDNYDIEDIDKETLASMIADCEAFQRDHWDDIASDLERAGADFWLSRNGHGAGFFDGPWPNADFLHKAAKVYGSFDLYVNDGIIYGN